MFVCLFFNAFCSRNLQWNRMFPPIQLPVDVHFDRFTHFFSPWFSSTSSLQGHQHVSCVFVNFFSSPVAPAMSSNQSSYQLTVLTHGKCSMNGPHLSKAQLMCFHYLYHLPISGSGCWSLTMGSYQPITGPHSERITLTLLPKDNLESPVYLRSLFLVCGERNAYICTGS